MGQARPVARNGGTVSRNRRSKCPAGQDGEPIGWSASKSRITRRSIWPVVIPHSRAAASSSSACHRGSSRGSSTTSWSWRAKSVDTGSKIGGTVSPVLGWGSKSVSAAGVGRGSYRPSLIRPVRRESYPIAGGRSRGGIRPGVFQLAFQPPGDPVGHRLLLPRQSHQPRARSGRGWGHQRAHDRLLAWISGGEWHSTGVVEGSCC